jgi:hypothetical protein
LLASRGQVHMVQVGANKGDFSLSQHFDANAPTHDTTRSAVQRLLSDARTRATLVEANPASSDQLVKRLERCKREELPGCRARVAVANVAVCVPKRAPAVAFHRVALERLLAARPNGVPSWTRSELSSLDPKITLRGIGLFVGHRNASAFVETIQVPCQSPVELLRSDRAAIAPSDLDALVVDTEGLDGAIVEGFMNATQPSAQPGLVFFEMHNALWDPTKRKQLRRLVRSLLRRRYRIYCCPAICRPLIPGSLRVRAPSVAKPSPPGKRSKAASTCDVGLNALAVDPQQLASSRLPAPENDLEYYVLAAPCPASGGGSGWACKQ